MAISNLVPLTCVRPWISHKNEGGRQCDHVAFPMPYLRGYSTRTACIAHSGPCDIILGPYIKNIILSGPHTMSRMHILCCYTHYDGLMSCDVPTH